MGNKFQFKESLYFQMWNNLCVAETSKCLELQMVKMKGNTTSDLKVHFWWYLVALSLLFINSTMEIWFERLKKTKANNYYQNYCWLNWVKNYPEIWLCIIQIQSTDCVEQIRCLFHHLSISASEVTKVPQQTFRNLNWFCCRRMPDNWKGKNL